MRERKPRKLAHGEAQKERWTRQWLSTIDDAGAQLVTETNKLVEGPNLNWFIDVHQERGAKEHREVT